MSDTIWLALIVGAFGVLTTYLTLTAPRRMVELNNAATAKALAIANERADRIAAGVKRDTEAVRVQVKQAAGLLVENDAKVAAQAKKTDAKLQGMHLLINSLYTAAKEGELRAVELTLTTLRILYAKEPTPDLLATAEATEIDRDRLRSELAERATAARFAAEKIEI